ncbi:hypothetical protein Tco_1167579 [Tanacetum coccineum]
MIFLHNRRLWRILQAEVRGRLSGYTYVITILQSEGSNGEDIFGKSSARIRETIERSNDMFSNDIFGEKKQEYEYLDLLGISLVKLWIGGCLDINELEWQIGGRKLG